MTIREEFKKAVLETFSIDGETDDYIRHKAKLNAERWIENNSYEFVMFKMGFIKGEEHGSKK